MEPEAETDMRWPFANAVSVLDKYLISGAWNWNRDCVILRRIIDDAQTLNTYLLAHEEKILAH